MADDIGGIKSGRYPECVLGRNFKVRSTPVSVRLRPEEAARNAGIADKFDFVDVLS